ncbi:MAG: type II toxin-antitoxin system VapC family toxin [Akkermansiaceae bacterium]
MRILLDTNMCIYIMKCRPAHVIERFQQYKPGDIAVTSITVAELQFGVFKSSQMERNRNVLIRFLAPLEILPFTSEAAEHYGRIKAQLRSIGSMIGELDCLIAAQALALKLPLVTTNTSKFERVPNLKLENWAEPS